MLIRRPLMQVDERRACGFDPVLVADWIGLANGLPVVDETCQRLSVCGCKVPQEA